MNYTREIREIVTDLYPHTERLEILENLLRDGGPVLCAAKVGQTRRDLIKTIASMREAQEISEEDDRSRAASKSGAVKVVFVRGDTEITSGPFNQGVVLEGDAVLRDVASSRMVARWLPDGWWVTGSSYDAHHRYERFFVHPA